MERRFYDMPGGQMSALHFGPTDQPIRCMFTHANGFNGQAYRSMLEQVGVHVIAPDMRGHGFTQLPTKRKSLRDFHIFADDIAVFISRYIPGNILLAGHSFSAVAGILSSYQLSDRLSAYVGFDPVTLPASARNMSRSTLGRWAMRQVGIAKNAGRRQAKFENIESVFERYKGRGAFRNVSDSILADYLEGGLLPHNEGVKLACDPLWEQAIYTAQGHNVFEGARHLPKNSKIIYAGKTPVSTPGTRAQIEEQLPKPGVIYKPDFHHMFPLVETDYCVSVLKEILQT